MLTNKIFNASALQLQDNKVFPLGSTEVPTAVSRPADQAQQVCRAQWQQWRSYFLAPGMILSPTREDTLSNMVRSSFQLVKMMVKGGEEWRVFLKVAFYPPPPESGTIREYLSLSAGSIPFGHSTLGYSHSPPSGTVECYLRNFSKITPKFCCLFFDIIRQFTPKTEIWALMGPL